MHMTPVPTIGKILYRPHRLIKIPEPMEVTSSPAMSGKSSSPDSVGLAPRTICRYVGR